MSLLGLAVVLAAGLAGPLLATPGRGRVPVVVGEILVGVLVGRTGTNWVDPGAPVLSFLAAAGFALVMLEAGSNVPLGDPQLRTSVGRGALLAAGVGAVAALAGFGIAVLAGTGHGPVYAVLIASSSAALVVPVLTEAKKRSGAALVTMAQVAIADTLCIVALPLVEDPRRAGAAALGVFAVLALGIAGFASMRWLRAHGVLDRLHRLSKRRHFGLELRVQLIVLFALAGFAEWLGVSVMLAGFVAGLMLRAQGEPRRLARQIFGVTDGFLAPVFFVWLGASVDLRALAERPTMILLAGLLAAAAVAVHAATRLVGQPLSLAVLSSAQLGVPVAAVTIGTAGRLLDPGEGAAMLASALCVVAVTALAAGPAGRAATDDAQAGPPISPGA